MQIEFQEHSVEHELLAGIAVYDLLVQCGTLAFFRSAPSY